MKNVKYSKSINIAKGIAKFYVNNVAVVFFQQKKTPTTKTANTKILSKAGDWTTNLTHSSLQCYLSATEATESVDWSQSFKLFQRNKSKHKQSQHCGPHNFNQVCFSVICLHEWKTIFGSFACLPDENALALLQYGLNVRCKQFWSKDTGISSYKYIWGHFSTQTTVLIFCLWRRMSDPFVLYGLQSSA